MMSAPEGGGGSWKSGPGMEGCVHFIVKISSKCGRRGRGLKNPKFCRCHIWKPTKVGLPGLLGARACPLIFRVICFTYALPTSPSAHSPPPPPPPANPIRARTATLKFPKMGPSPLSLVSDRMSRRIFGIPSEYSAGDIVAF